jgi:DNA-binding GntR family transcriptional regulator
MFMESQFSWQAGSVNSDNRGDSSVSAAREGSLADSAYARLKRLILTAEFAPGAYVFERDMAARLEMSRTPVREALTRLEGEGLVTPHPRRGYVIASMDPQQAEHLYAVREALETLAVRLIGRLSSEKALELESVIEASAKEPPARPKVSVHEFIVRQSGNPYLHKTWREIVEKLLPYMWVEALYDEADRTYEEHRRLCRYLGEGDTEAAQGLMSDHIRRARDNLVRALTLQAGEQGREGANREEKGA